MKHHYLAWGLVLIGITACGMTTPGGSPDQPAPATTTAAPTDNVVPTEAPPTVSTQPITPARATITTEIQPTATAEATVVQQVAPPSTVVMADVTTQPSEGGQPMEQPRPGSPVPSAMIARVTSDLGKRLGIAESTISLVAATAVEWPDGGLGCPDPDRAYIMMIVPGYQITLEAEGKRYSYHTDTEATIVLCQDGKPVL